MYGLKPVPFNRLKPVPFKLTHYEKYGDSERRKSGRLRGWKAAAGRGTRWSFEKGAPVFCPAYSAWKTTSKSSRLTVVKMMS
jgi:hypothetical protein